MTRLAIYADVTLRPGVTHADVHALADGMNAVATIVHGTSSHPVVSHVVTFARNGETVAHIVLAPGATARDAQALRDALSPHASAVTFRRGEPVVPLDTRPGPIGETVTA